MKRYRQKCVPLLLLSLVPFSMLSSAIIPVNNEATLRAAILTANGSPGSTITFTAPVSFTLTQGELPPIMVNTTIDGGNNAVTINGNATSRIFFVYSGTVNLNNFPSLTLTNTKALGGTGGNLGMGGGSAGGGGGGLGAGGAIFVNTGANVSIQNVNFTNNNAAGGPGGTGGLGNTNGGGGGGGGMLGNGGNGSLAPQLHGGSGGGGGGGHYVGCTTCTLAQLNGVQPANPTTDQQGGAGGQGGANGGAGGAQQAPATTVGINGNLGNPGASAGQGGGGGAGGSSVANGGFGCNPSLGGNGGNGASGNDFAGGGGGGGGGNNDNCAASTGFGSSGGPGGFGGGGGGGATSGQGGVSGGNGGFGGGGGGGGGDPPLGTSIYGGGTGAIGFSSNGGGGGGAALGGAIFVRQGGTLTIQGNTTISGNTAGVAGSGGAGGNGGGNGIAQGDDIFLMSGGMLTFALTSNLTIPSVIAADNLGPTNGGLQVNNSPGVTLILQGANIYTGTTTLSNGILQIGADNNLGNVNNPISMNGGTLQANASFATSRTITIGANSVIDTGGANTITLNGTSSGNGGLLVQDSGIAGGTVVMTNSNLYTGGTTIGPATLALTTNGANSGSLSPTGFVTLSTPTSIFDISGLPNSTSVVIGDLNGVTSSQIHLGNKQLTMGTNTPTTTFAGFINGAGGSFTKQGNGTLNLTGNSTYTGQTTINAGTLNVDGMIVSSVLVNVGGTLSGNGTVGSIVNNGTVSPGTTGIGIITANGNYTQNPQGNLDVEISDSGASDLHAITGTASLNGTLNVFPLPGSYVAGTYTYTILDATGGVSGQFSLVNIIDPQLDLQMGVLYLPNQVQLVILNNQFFFGTVIKEFNPRHVEQYLERITYINGTVIPSEADLFSIVLDLSTLDHHQLVEALDQMQPSQFGAFEIVTSNLRSQIASILNRHPSEQCCHRLDVCCSPCGNASIYAEPFGMLIDQERVYDQRGFDSALGGMLLGANYAFENNMLIGTAIGGTDSYLKWDGHTGYARIKSGFLALYADWLWDIWYLESSLIGGKDFFEVARHIEFPGVDRTAKNHHKGFDIMAHIGAGVDWNWNKICFHPYFLTDYSFLHQESYQEEGAQSLNLIVNARHDQMIRIEEGFYITRSFKTKRGCLAPSIWLGYVSEIPIGRQLFISSLEGQNVGTFTSRGFGKVSNRLSPGFDIAWKATDCISMAFRYSAEIGRYFTAQKGDFRMEWCF